MQYDILVLGDYFFDQIFSELPRFPVLGCETYAQELVSTGGAMYITATALQRLGVRVGWPAYFGDDYYSQYVYNLAQKTGIDLSLARLVERPYRRVTTSIPYQGERAFVTFADPNPDDLREYWLSSMDRCEFSHVHLGGWTSVPDLRPLAAQ
jgi:sugar/nucleoside kinase (ribokinase family)